MLTIYQIDKLGQWTGSSREIGDDEGWDAAWTLAPEPPEVAGGECAFWASNSWHVHDRIDPEAASSVEPVQSD
jgi:hypothetical protein